jgi:hypothetical protein
MYPECGYSFGATIMTANLDIPDGSEFPNLKKANLLKKLEDLVNGLMSNDKEFFKLAQDKKVKLRKQREIDLKSFLISQKNAIDRGNQNACDARHNFNQVATNQNIKVKPISIPSSSRKSATGKGKSKTNLPPTKSATPTSGGRRSPSLAKAKLNQPTGKAVSTRSHFIEAVETSLNSAKSQRNMSQFVKAQSGERGTSLGDRAIVFSANGTPHYGDSYLDKNVHENLSANQATSNIPLSQIPSRIEKGKPISANPLQQQPRANVAPKSDSVGNMLVLGGIAAAVTAVLFLFQYVLMFVQLILQISSVTSTITNIAGSFVAILNNVGSLFGLGEGVVDPLSKTMDSILNNTFGLEKVSYVKYQFAKISSAFVAGSNLMNQVSGMTNSVGKVAEDNANNTSKIGNALKSMGMLKDAEPWMNENNKVSGGLNSLGGKLDSVSGLASSLGAITTEVKTAKKSQEDLDKEYATKQKEIKESVAKSSDKNSDKIIPDLNIFNEVPAK